MSVLVFGSLNMDLVTRVSRMPRVGETLQGSAFFTCSGGKGSNQAVAAARLGASVSMVGRVGKDSFGKDLLSSLQATGVNCDRVFVDSETHTGVATIAVDDLGNNQIAIVAGANGQIDASDLLRLEELLPIAKVLLLQLEIPLVAVEAAAIAARNHGVTVILDPAPASVDLPASLYATVDILTPNEVEASQLVGFEVRDRASAERAAGVLLERGVRIAIVKLGDRGVVVANQAESWFMPAFVVAAIDTTAAGDAFNGALAVAIAEGKTLLEAVRWGAAAGALCAMQLGAQTAMPSRDRLEGFLNSRSSL